MTKMGVWHLVRCTPRGEPYLGNGDGRNVEQGRKVVVYGNPRPGMWGLHACSTLQRAIRWAPLSRLRLCQVTLSGKVIPSFDEFGEPDVFAATERTIDKIWTLCETHYLLCKFVELWLDRHVFIPEHVFPIKIAQDVIKDKGMRYKDNQMAENLALGIHDMCDRPIPGARFSDPASWY